MTTNYAARRVIAMAQAATAGSPVNGQSFEAVIFLN